MTRDLSKYLASGFRRFSSGLMLSRISGLGRDLVMAYVFGDHPSVAALLIAFRFSHLLRRFLGEGALQSAFVPHFEGLKNQDENRAYGFFQQLTRLLSIILLLIVIVLEVGATSIMSVVPTKNREILYLTTWMLPSLIFISLYGLNLSFLQCHNSFFIPNISPCISNMMWMVGALSLKGQAVGEAMPVLAKWVVVGFVIQWIATLPQVRQFVRRKTNGPLLSKEVKVLAKIFSLGALGVGAMQINSFLDVIFSRYAHSSGPLYLWYASRFQQFALAMFGIATVSTLAPVLSRAIKCGDIERGKEIFIFGCRRVLTVMLLMTFAIHTLGFGAIDLIFGRGNFSPYAVDQTSKCLIAYSLGLIPTALIMLYSVVSYAEGDFRRPTIFSFFTMGINLVLNSLFVFGLGLGAVSIAWATSIGGWCNYCMLRYLLLKRGWSMGQSLSSLTSLLSTALLASLAIWFLEGFLRQIVSNRLCLFVVPGILFSLIFVFYAFCIKDWSELKAIVR